MKKGSTKKGLGVSYEMLKTAIEATSGDVSAIRERLNLNTNGSVYYLLNTKWPVLKQLQEELKTGRRIEAGEVAVFDLDSKDAPVLTPVQIQILEFIDEKGRDGTFVDVSHFHYVALKNLIDRGFIEHRYEDNCTWAKLTESGDIARIWHIDYESKDYTDYRALHHAEKNGEGKRRERKPKGEAISYRETSQAPSVPKEDLGEALHSLIDNFEPTAPVSKFPFGSKIEPACNCENCLDHEVLSFIISNRPEFANLVTQVQKMKAAEREALAYLKKIGGAS